MYSWTIYKLNRAHWRRWSRYLTFHWYDYERERFLIKHKMVRMETFFFLIGWKFDRTELNRIQWNEHIWFFTYTLLPKSIEWFGNFQNSKLCFRTRLCNFSFLLNYFNAFCWLIVFYFDHYDRKEWTNFSWTFIEILEIGIFYDLRPIFGNVIQLML